MHVYEENPAKASFRRKIWQLLEEKGVVRFPGSWGRIPNFIGAEQAARRLSELDIWKEARTLKCNPDAPQQPVRLQALQAGKTVFMAVPRLRSLRCFIRLDPSQLGHRLREASTIRGAFALGKPVTLEEMEAIDLVIAGSVVVNPQGARIGKGGGYSDLEFALARQWGLISAHTPVVTTVHPLQVVKESLPMMIHDIPVDFIITPEEVVATHSSFPKPEGLYWELLASQMWRDIPVLQWMRQKQGN